jgi:protein SSD1
VNIYTKEKLDDDENEEEVFNEDRIFAKVVKIHSSLAYEQLHPGVLSIQKPGTELDPNFNIQDIRTIWFKPTDKRIPFMRIQSERVPSVILRCHDIFETTLFTAKMVKWRDESLFPLATYCGKVGQLGELHTESECLLIENRITWETFSDEIIDSLAPTIPDEEISSRRDLRNECIFSIDPPTARDLDDALSCKLLEHGDYEIGVHIADVSYFVKPDTPLDHEALHRATSVYLVQKVIPMLPRLLCEELCSLNAGVDRLAFSVFWRITKDGEIVGKPEFCKTVIKSCAKLWYGHAQAVFEPICSEPNQDTVSY